jgi:C-terminal binding protein
MPFRVVLTNVLTPDIDREREILGEIAELAVAGAKTEEEMFGQVEDADAILNYHSEPMSRRILERLRNCRLIVRCGVGYDNIDVRFARERGIAVANVPSYGSEEVADSAIGLTLSLTRGIAYLNSYLRSSENPWTLEPVRPLHRLRGRVFGIVGIGRIGTAAALRAKALGMEVVFYDPYKPDGYEKAVGVRRAETLEELLRRTYVLSLHCPLTDETRRLIGAAQMEQLPAGAYLVNTARGPVVDTAAVPGAIASGRLAGAGFDVLEKEPPDPAHPLLRAWRDPGHPAHHRVILNAHNAFYCEEGLLEMREKGAETCRRFLLGLPVRTIVN